MKRRLRLRSRSITIIIITLALGLWTVAFAQGASTQGASTQGASAQGASAQGASTQGSSAQGSENPFKVGDKVPDLQTLSKDDQKIIQSIVDNLTRLYMLATYENNKLFFDKNESAESLVTTIMILFLSENWKPLAERQDVLDHYKKLDPCTDKILVYAVTELYLRTKYPIPDSRPLPFFTPKEGRTNADANLYLPLYERILKDITPDTDAWVWRTSRVYTAYRYSFEYYTDATGICQESVKSVLKAKLYARDQLTFLTPKK